MERDVRDVRDEGSTLVERRPPDFPLDGVRLEPLEDMTRSPYQRGATQWGTPVGASGPWRQMGSTDTTAPFEVMTMSNIPPTLERPPTT